MVDMPETETKQNKTKPDNLLSIMNSTMSIMTCDD